MAACGAELADGVRHVSAGPEDIIQVNTATFGMAAVVGAISGLAQIGNSASSYSPFYGFREGVSQQTAASSEQILSHYLNRLPTITIKPGSRVKLILTADITGVPEYRNHAMPVNR
jgi:type IV secretory pathway VirB10-like protein